MEKRDALTCMGTWAPGQLFMHQTKLFGMINCRFASLPGSEVRSRATCVERLFGKARTRRRLDSHLAPQAGASNSIHSTMPEYRSITFALHSPFAVEAIRELEPLPQEHYTSRGIVRTVPKVVDEGSSTCSVYVPATPGSIFWISYSVSPPVPDGHYFLFKLYVNGTHIVSWSTGKEQEWQGKTMFGLYNRPEDEEGRKRVEKRVLSFTSPDEQSKKWDDVKDPFEDKMRMEIKVHRAHGRVRIDRQMEEYSKTAHAHDAKGIRLVNGGRATSEQPKRFYKFALIDPVDQPFATFRYYYRTWEQLEDLGFSEHEERCEGEENDMPVIEPCEAARDEEEVFYEGGDGAADTRYSSAGSQQLQLRLRSPTKRSAKHKSGAVNAMQPPVYIPRGAPPPRYRLSMPPSIRLSPPDDTSRPLPRLPHKSDSQSSISYRPHPAYPLDEWRVRTPSPVNSVRKGLSTPPLAKRREGSRASSLISAISSTWRRRGATSAGSNRSAEGQGGTRSTSS
ncbi:hypothetical protein CC86DRAFT_456841 [Ophiobolus disseminans]|uniref:DUF7918 domain-containing protein n=1 Tax=Ophiobolus disseminans TaxID=1469910 RepID=A0A6A6ZVW5_9PLEO|nr:hypothetical protein CC86DRAFT_456841 [Ophiobolus disseminans]